MFPAVGWKKDGRLAFPQRVAISRVAGCTFAERSVVGPEVTIDSMLAREDQAAAR